MGDGAIRNGPAETYYCQPRCRDPSGDDYVTFTGKTVLIRPARAAPSRAWLKQYQDQIRLSLRGRLLPEQRARAVHPPLFPLNITRIARYPDGQKRTVNIA
ncbi:MULTISPECIES: hypothetical protein [unclassified Methanoculleus]|jgi:hypothetical protein|nr:hypothetical protein [Methanoculleus sp. UBA377]